MVDPPHSTGILWPLDVACRLSVKGAGIALGSATQADLRGKMKDLGIWLFNIAMENHHF
jgi:hypothetical protein